MLSLTRVSREPLMLLFLTGCPSFSVVTSPETASDDAPGLSDTEEVTVPTTTPPEVPDEPPFACEPLQVDSHVLDGIVLFDPAEPHPGDTLTVVVRATNGLGRLDGPPLDLEVTSGSGTDVYSPQAVEGGEVIYYYAIPDVAEGDLCVTGLIDGAPEVSARVAVTPRPPSPPANQGVFKVVTNHQWTCGEQPTYGNEFDVWVLDENGVGIPGAVVDVGLADSTDLDSIYNDDGAIPSKLYTDGSGHYTGWNFWPISDNGLLVFQLSVDGAASDIATELTTGWWEDDLQGCNYCGEHGKNVWGHWSYTVVFQRDPVATEACVVDNDHAGMGACGTPRHIHHHPDVQACWGVSE